MVDFHAHILPGADHGSSSLQTSLAQIKLANECGVDKIIATPHFYPSMMSVERFLSLRDKAYELLLPHIDPSSIRLGAEVLICDNIQNLPDLEKLCLYGSRTILLELPFNHFDKNYKYIISDLVKDGYEVILAHADRYVEDNIDLLLNYGAKIQLNAESLDVLFKRKKLYTWMENGFVVALGSDIHGADKKAYKRFVNATKKAGKHWPVIDKASEEIWQKLSIYN